MYVLEDLHTCTSIRLHDAPAAAGDALAHGFRGWLSGCCRLGSLFTDRDLLAPSPLITNRGQSLFTNRVLLQGGIPESGTASKVISSPGTVLGNQDDIGSIIASCCICCRAGSQQSQPWKLRNSLISIGPSDGNFERQLLLPMDATWHWGQWGGNECNGLKGLRRISD